MRRYRDVAVVYLGSVNNSILLHSSKDKPYFSLPSSAGNSAKKGRRKQKKKQNYPVLSLNCSDLQQTDGVVRSLQTSPRLPATILGVSGLNQVTQVKDDVPQTLTSLYVDLPKSSAIINTTLGRFRFPSSHGFLYFPPLAPQLKAKIHTNKNTFLPYIVDK